MSSWGRPPAHRVVLLEPLEKLIELLERERARVDGGLRGSALVLVEVDGSIEGDAEDEVGELPNESCRPGRGAKARKSSTPHEKAPGGRARGACTQCCVVRLQSTGQPAHPPGS